MTSPFCVHFERFKPSEWNNVNTMMTAVAPSRGSPEPKTANEKAAAAYALIAIGAEKPTKSDAQPAKYPTAG